jgi:hypothetical protein
LAWPEVSASLCDRLQVGYPAPSDLQPSFAIRIILGGSRFSLSIIRHTAIFVVGHRKRHAKKKPAGECRPDGGGR